MKSKPIYTITAIATGGKAPKTRCFGFYHQKSDAFEAVKENRYNLHEYLYSFLVIEEFYEGIHSFPEKEIWFKWNMKKWTSCDKPKWSNHVVCWALG